MRLILKTMLFMLIVGFTPLSLMSVISYTTLEKSVKQTIHNNLFSLAKEIGKEVERTVNEGFSNILLLAENPVIRSTQTSRKEKQAELIKTQKYHRIFKDISYFDPRGETVASVFHSFRGAWKSTRWFKSAIADNSNLSNVHAVLYPFDIVMTASTAVKDKNDNITGILVGQLDMERVWQITKNVSSRDGGEVLLVDERGIVIAAPDSDRLLEPIDNDVIRNGAIKRKAGITIFGEDDAKKVAVYVPFESVSERQQLKWCAVLVRSQKDLYSSVYRSRNALLIASCISLFAIILLSFLLSGKISSRIRKLADATQSLGKGDFSVKLSNFGKDEIGQLATTFNWASRQIDDSYQRNQQAKEALKKAHDELEIRVQERTTELSEANEKLKQEIEEKKRAEAESVSARKEAETANQAKSDFLANMSHELRTPMNHIIGFTEIILDKNLGELNDIQAEYLMDVHKSSHHLLSLINDILDLSKVEAGKLELQPSSVNLRKVLKNSLGMVKEKTMNHGIKLSTNLNGLPDTITADERKLKQILYNLLSNAVKFTSEGGEVTVTARPCCLDNENVSTVDKKQSGNVKISVSDTGIGLNPEDFDRIFNPFDQVEGYLTSRFQGTGLGLSLTKKLVELHGGKIWAESEGEGKGSTFSFIIPVTPRDIPFDSDSANTRGK
jgi:signal transduction histidine kinase